MALDERGGVAPCRRRSLRDWRNSLGLCQHDVASAMGVSSTWVSTTERAPLARSKQAERLRAALLAIAKRRLESARVARNRDIVMRQARRAWARLPAPSRGQFTAAMCDLVREYLWCGEVEEADVIGLLMPGGVYQALLDEYFDAHCQGGDR